MPAEDALLSKLTNLGHELLGDWLLKPDIQAAWRGKSLPLEWFPNIQLAAIAKAANDGIDPDDLPLALSRNGSAAIWPHPADAIDLLLKVPTRSLSFDKQVDEIRETYGKRKLREVLQSNVTKVDAKSIDAIMKDIGALKPPEVLEALPVMPTEDLFATLGPEPWICDALALQPGAPWMLSGNSGRGKSWVVTDLTLAVSSGQLFGGLAVRQGRCRWIHLEGGRRDLQKRVQFLAAGRQLGPSDLHGNLLASCHPSFNFMDPKLEPRLIRECDGFAMCVIDTFAVAAAGMNENDSSIRQPLDMLGRVSEATGCAFIVIHHHRKAPADSRVKVDLEEMTRGSGALANALSASWAITRMKKTDRSSLFRSKLTLGKSWYGERDALIVEAIHSHIVSGAVDLHITRAPVDDGSEDDEGQRDYTEQDQLILDTVAKFPDGVTLTALAGLARIRRQLLNERVQAMLARGQVTQQDGPRNSRLIRPAGSQS